MASSAFSSALEILSKSAFALALGAAGLMAQPNNTIMLERWDGIAGTAVSDLTGNPNYPNNPTSRTYPTLYESPTNAADNYGTRTRGYVTPPTTGNYTFWIAADDNAELWLGTSSDPATARVIATVPGYASPRQWTKFTQQQSAAIALTGGVRYYIETRHKEGGGGDNLAVGWQGPGITGDAERPIPGSRLAPYLLGVAPAIVTQPAPRTVNVGQTANFTVTASGTAPLAYQWVRNGANIGGATSASYTTPPTISGDNGAQFSVVVSNAFGTATSATVILTVNTPPVITTQPASQTVNVGQTATFSVAASGTAPLAYQWTRNNANIAGANSPTYTTPPATAADNLTGYAVIVSNVAGNVTSATANLIVNSPPVILTQPVSQTVIAGQTASFTVSASGTAPLAYQWRKNGVNIGGANAPTYITPAATAADNGALFSVVVSNALGTATSVNAVLTVIIPPTITVQPGNQTVNAGQITKFTLTATGTAPLAYQWRKNGVNIPGATGLVYTTPVLVPADNGSLFSVVVSNAGGSVTSTNALLTVITVASNNQKIAVSGELVDAAGNPLGYPAPVTVDAIIKLYDDAAAGALLYSEEFRAAAGKGVKVTNGLFVARLGEGVAVQNLQQVLAANANLWAEVTIDDGTPDVLLPRTPLTAAPYALGGNPAPAAASLSGGGDPNAMHVAGDVGAIYVNTDDNATWLKLKSGWKRMD